MMNDFMENLKVRAQTALQRLQRAQQQFASAQGELNAATQDYNSWNYAVQAETRRVLIEEAMQAGGPQAPADTVVAATPETTSSIASAPEITKTDQVRDVLRQHPQGIKPTDIGVALKNQVAMTYIYSVLKRLKDRDEVAKKKGGSGKYYLKQHSQTQPTEEMAVQNGVVVMDR